MKLKNHKKRARRRAVWIGLALATATALTIAGSAGALGVRW